MFKKDDKVYSLRFGSGVILKIDYLTAATGSAIKIPVCCCFDTNLIEWFCEDGRYRPREVTVDLYHSKPEIIAPPEPIRFPHVAIDQPVFVRNSSIDNWSRRHFRAWNKETGQMVCWNAGKTSWTAEKNELYCSHWPQWNFDIKDKSKC